MKRRTILVAFGGIFLASTLAGVPVYAADQTPLSIVEQYLTAWNAHDAAKAASYFDEKVSYYDASVGKPTVGKAEAKAAVIDNFMTAAPDLKWVMRGDPIVSGNKVSFEWTFTGNNSGAWADGTAATNKPFSLDGASVFVIENNAIKQQSDYYDALGFYKQLGLM
ncbi:ester cyclase [Rhizobium mesoamericanum]|uniref:ester cyclase n=1 Tax=Rhizobium mesoamericanum TaxID=1079800 RepID=UPI00040C7F7E|nr:ester cyclase [Rhizobium mesoamericanum]